MRWQEILNERGEAYLYHITHADVASKIIYDDQIKALTDHRVELLGMKGSRKATEYGTIAGVSLTRNPLFQKVWCSGEGVMFCLDANRLRQSIELRPIDYYSGGKHTGYGSVRSEAEEFAIGPIKPLHRFLAEVRITRALYDECVADNEQWVDPEENSFFWHLTSCPKLKII
jgi:hypothetical protein